MPNLFCQNSWIFDVVFLKHQVGQVEFGLGPKKIVSFLSNNQAVLRRLLRLQTDSFLEFTKTKFGVVWHIICFVIRDKMFAFGTKFVQHRLLLITVFF